MILPNPNGLNRFNKYALVMLAAKRARQLQEQGIAPRALVESHSTNPLTIALEEIAAGRLIPSFNPEPLPELMEPETPQLALTEGFEEARARVVDEDILKPSDNGHEQEATDEAEEGLSEEEQSIADAIDEALGLDEESEEALEIPEADDTAFALDEVGSEQESTTDTSGEEEPAQPSTEDATASEE